MTVRAAAAPRAASESDDQRRCRLAGDRLTRVEFFRIALVNLTLGITRRYRGNFLTGSFVARSISLGLHHRDKAARGWHGRPGVSALSRIYIPPV